MRTLRRALLTLVAAAAAALVPLLPAAAAPVTAAGPAVTANVDDFAFRSMHADYTIGRDTDGTSTLRVVETFVALFPQTDQNHGMRRSIPDTYNGQPLDLKLVSVTDQNGTPRPAEVDHDDDTFTITSRDPGFVHGAQTYVFTYTLRHVTWTFGDTDADEFYWDVNGVDWAQPFGTVSATLHVPADLASAMTGAQSCYQGDQGATDACSISADAAGDGGRVVTASAQQLFPGQTMTIAVGFDRGTFTPFDASIVASPWGWAQSIAGLGALAALGMGIVARVRRLRDAPGRPTIIAEYTPPEGIDALIAAVMRGATPKAIPAEVLEQAVGGSIRIIEGEKRMFGAHKMQAELVDRDRGVDEDGRMLLAGMFGKNAAPGAVFTFGGTNSRFAKAGQKMLRWAAGQLSARGLRRSVPRKVRSLPVAVASIALIATLVTGIFALASYVSPAVPIIIMLVATAATVTSVIVVARKPLTAAGAEVRDQLEGLKLFIEWAEADRIRMLQSPTGAERVPVDVNDPRQMIRLYEKLLPYAVVFGQEKQWADRLAAMYPAGQTPYWYAGTSGFNAATFAAGVGSLSSAAASSSSTSGGSSGGGSAGGGGGGGGGGGV
ncbi:DUF2207 domain-containing protein [Microbacterium sp.]|uniref:DUF2207 domain-containing protein n=1 Tax=Microbacterium sp. TaxID=51671 RepID=UPI003A933E23